MIFVHWDAELCFDEIRFLRTFVNNEGLAGYESGQMSPDWRAALAQKVADGAIPTIRTDLTPADKWCLWFLIKQPNTTPPKGQAYG